MTKILTAFFLLVILNAESLAQKKPEIVYNPIPGANIEEAFPVAAAVLLGNYKVGIEQIDWGKGTMTSTYVEYLKLLNKVRSKYQVIIDANGTLNVEMVDVQLYENMNKEWISESYGNKEKKMKAVFIFDINGNLQKPDVVKKCQDWFYKELYINALFFENATELAGNRWFDNYLKDKKVSWKVVFHDIKKNTGGQYKFMEEYSRVLSTMTTVQTNFLLTKFTNSDKNTMASKNLPIVLEGYCRSLSYSDGVFNISLTDEVDSAIPNNSFQQDQPKEQKSVLDFAEKLKQLKSLLDQGIITKEEYETEKKKILADKQ